MFIKIQKTITEQRKVLIVLDDMIGDMEPNKK